MNKKMLVVPVDGSENSNKSINYLSFLWGAEHFSQIALIHIIASQPSYLLEEARKDREMAKRLKSVQEKNKQFAEETLAVSEKILVNKGFSPTQLIKAPVDKKLDIPRDICRWAEGKKVDAVAVSSAGRSKIEAFFLGENASKVLERSRDIPVWIIKGNVSKKPVLVCVDDSENALRAVDHAGYMLSGSDMPIILFHTTRSLTTFFPRAILDAAPGLDEKCRETAGNKMTRVIDKAKQMLLDAGIKESKISIKIQEGTRNAAADIMKAADKLGVGTIVMGKHGGDDAKTYAMGGVVRKVIENAKNVAMWVVP